MRQNATECDNPDVILLDWEKSEEDYLKKLKKTEGSDKFGQVRTVSDSTGQFICGIIRLEIIGKAVMNDAVSIEVSK